MEKKYLYPTQEKEECTCMCHYECRKTCNHFGGHHCKHCAKPSKKLTEKEITDLHNNLSMTDHIKIHNYKPRMVKDPLKYRGKGRPRKSDYITFDELVSRHILSHQDMLDTITTDILIKD